MKVLNIVESAYRATLEEQDDTIVWLTHAMRGAGADLGVLLTGESVNYAVKKQDASGLSFGDKKQTQPPKIDEQVAALVEKGVPVYAVEDDMGQLGIEGSDLVPDIKTVSRGGIASLMGDFDQVWHW